MNLSTTLLITVVFFGLSNQQNLKGIYCNQTGNFIEQLNGEYRIKGCGNSDIEIGTWNRSSITSFDFSNNLVQTIEDRHFEGATKLVNIFLTNNLIKEISCRAFVDQERLRKLVLMKNQLRSLKKGVFDPLISLRDLHLNENQLSVIQNDLFRRNFNLEKIDLQLNRIVSIESQVFDSLPDKFLLVMNGNLCAHGTYTRKTAEKLSECFRNHETEIIQMEACEIFSNQIESSPIVENPCNSNTYSLWISIVIIIALIVAVIILSVYLVINSKPPNQHSDFIQPYIITDQIISENPHGYVDMSGFKPYSRNNSAEENPFQEYSD